MKKRITQVVATFSTIILLVSYCLPVSYASTYWDVAENDWHTEAIEYVTANGLMQGVGNGNFQPNQPLTRAQVVTLLYRLAGNPKTEYTGHFQDVPQNEWYASSVSWAYQQGIVNGTSETTFSPLTNITREQLAVMINNFIKTTETELQMAENAFYRVKDCWSVSPYAEDGVVMVCETGLMNPDSQYNFNPKSNVTRADAAVVFMRLSKALVGEQLTGTLIPGTAIDFSKLSLSQEEKDAQALAVAKQIVAVIPAGKSDIERVMMAAHIVSHYSKFCMYTMSGSDYYTAYGVFVKGEYSCAGSTRALGMVLTCMGFQWRHINEHLYTHQWCELDIDGRTVVADGQIGRVGYKTGDSIEYVSRLLTSYIDPWPYTLQ